MKLYHYAMPSTGNVLIGNSKAEIIDSIRHFKPEERNIDSVFDLEFSMSAPLALVGKNVSIEPIQGVRFGMTTNYYDLFKERVEEMDDEGKLHRLNFGLPQSYSYASTSFIDNFLPKNLLMRFKERAGGTVTRVYLPGNIAKALKNYDFSQHDSQVKELNHELAAIRLKLNLKGQLATPTRYLERN